MEPWSFDSPAMRELLPRLLAGEFQIRVMYLPVARTDDDPFTSKLLLKGIIAPGDDSQH